MLEADIAADTFPCNGGTTTCHALWMGLPVISLAGALPMQRIGLSILGNVGLSDLVTTTPEQFAARAAGLAADIGQLGELRRTMRNRMANSPLMDEPARTRDIESAFRSMWRTFAGGKA